jgi:polyisoprenoid-binding protein YceI
MNPFYYRRNSNLGEIIKEKIKTMRKIALSIVILTIFNMANGQEIFKADKEKTVLQWLGEKVTGQHTGTIQLLDGWLRVENNIIVAGEFSIDMSTIRDDDGNKNLEGHLKSEDFFGVDKYPVSKLLITGSDPFDKGTSVVRGTLTIKDISNPVEFKASVQQKAEGTWYYANITVDRTKYNVRYGSGSFFANLGDKIIYDEFKLKVTLLVKK